MDRENIRKRAGWGDAAGTPGAFYNAVLERPWSVLLLAMALVAACALGLSRVEKDPSVDAFVPDGHPAAINRDIAREVFGLEDPVIVGLAVGEGETVFTPERLEALRRIDAGVRQIEGVKKNDVLSLASQNAIAGDDGDLIVDPIIEEGPLDAAAAARARDRFEAMPMLSGLLAAGDHRLLTLIIPVEDPNNAVGTVNAIRARAEAEGETQFDVHVAGVAAMNARLADMVDSDTRIFVPAAIVTVLIILYVALRLALALVGPLVVIIGSVGIGIGAMGWLGAHYYLITTALPLVIMAIAVADTLHLSAYYLRARADDPTLTAKAAIGYAVERAWLPITLTTITTLAAFVGLSFGAAMKPISEFGLFAALGIAGAWVLSLTALPAILILSDLTPGPKTPNLGRRGWIDLFVEGCNRLAFDRPFAVLAGVAGLTALLGVFAAQAEFDYERKRYFAQDDAVRIADIEIGSRLGGVNFLDVVVTAPEQGGLMTPAALTQIRDLRNAIAELPLVVKVAGIDEYISLMHGALTGAPADALPTAERAPGQYMFLYEASAPPEDFKQEIDFDYTRALIRSQLSTDSYSQTLPTVEALERLTADWSSRNGLSADVSGRVAVNDGWMTQLAENHFRGLGLAVLLVLATTVIVFRSLYYALFAMVPVLVGVVSVYAVMGAFGIDIAPATSMTAAIATGLGIDFGIHLISLVRQRRLEGHHAVAAFRGHYTTVARACFYSAFALGVALAVLCISSAPPLRWFGFLVSVGAFGSLVGALIIVPALWSVADTLKDGEKRNATA